MHRSPVFCAGARSCAAEAMANTTTNVHARDTRIMVFRAFALTSQNRPAIQPVSLDEGHLCV